MKKQNVQNVSFFPLRFRVYQHRWTRTLASQTVSNNH
jgi:hypothetical protein